MQTAAPELLSMVAQLQNRVQTLETSLAQHQIRPALGFFASLYQDNEDGTHGPFGKPTTIVYKKVLTNEGNMYNAATGIFTAPVNGLYVFHFTLFDDSKSPNAKVSLRKNGVKMAYSFIKAGSDLKDSSTRAVVVTLKAGDSVWVELQAHTCFYGYHGDYNSFSGFLLSPM